MKFGEAIEALKQGKMVRRGGWNGKGMFLFIRPDYEHPTNQLLNIKSINQPTLHYLEEKNTERKIEQTLFTAYITMYAADGTLVNGWLASQTDMLAEDWELVYNPYEFS